MVMVSPLEAMAVLVLPQPLLVHLFTMLAAVAVLHTMEALPVLAVMVVVVLVL
jgi:hypothetical protein